MPSETSKRINTPTNNERYKPAKKEQIEMNQKTNSPCNSSYRYTL